MKPRYNVNFCDRSKLHCKNYIGGIEFLYPVFIFTLTDFVNTIFSENQQKVIQDRITAIETHLGQLCDISSSYTRKTARLRDKGL